MLSLLLTIVFHQDILNSVITQQTSLSVPTVSLHALSLLQRLEPLAASHYRQQRYYRQSSTLSALRKTVTVGTHWSYSTAEATYSLLAMTRVATWEGLSREHWPTYSAGAPD